MDEKSLVILEFPRVREILAGFTSFSASRNLALSLRPMDNHEQISLLLRQSAEARRLLEMEPNFSVGGVTDIREAAGLAARGKVLEPQTLAEIHWALAAIHQLRGSLSRVSSEFTLLWDIASRIVEFRQLENDIDRCLSPTGELLDSASPRLVAVRHQLKQARERLLVRLDAIVRSPRGRRIVQEAIVTEREGRYVIPIKIEARNEIKGIVHDVSNTGATVFVEPLVTVDMGNEMRELVAEEKREIERILRELSAGVGVYEAEIVQDIALVAEIDLALAKARYARKAGATEPEITTFARDGKGQVAGESGVLRLVDARHPLIAGKAVPLSVEIGKDYSILVITGPNTGGKTVALKTIGLLSMMAQAGLPVPASEKSSIPVFDSIFADIGDEQSIEQTLSTFSWHMGNISRIINITSSRSLVLLDELGTSTDPVEGSALARSLLLHFRSQGIMTVATTHFSDIKTFAHATPGFQNASMDFDPVTLAPTYHLRPGVPGGSNALATAARLGIPTAVIDGAKEMISEGTQQLEALLADLMTEKQQAEAITASLQVEKEQTEQRRTELENELRTLKREERKVIQEARDLVVNEVAELQREIRQAISDLRKEKSREKVEQARRSMAAVQEQMNSEVWQAAPVTADIALEEDDMIAVGDTVLLKEANLQATVLSLSGDTQQVEVQAGQTRLKLGLSGVEKVKSGAGARVDAVRMVKPPPRKKASLELDLRGKRADEVTPELDTYLNDASLSNLGEVRIIHGFGTGVVRTIVRDFLHSHPLVRSYRPGERGEGGDGVTMVKL